MREEVLRHACTPGRENITSTTLAGLDGGVTGDPAPARARGGRCGYVVAPGARPFCDRPALPGGSYCAWHRALCAVAPADPAFAALAALQVEAADAVAPPSELAWLRTPAPPEPLDESDDERLAGLELPPAEIFRDE